MCSIINIKQSKVEVLSSIRNHHTCIYAGSTEWKKIYLEQLQLVLCVASTKSQHATLSGISSSVRPPDEAEYFLLKFEIIKIS